MDTNAPARRNPGSTPALPILDLEILRTLVAIEEGGSFSAAAQTVGRTPSAVSMQVKKLEDRLGRALFSRDTRSVRLTPDGVFIVDHARQMLALNRRAVERFLKPVVRGRVRLGAPDDVTERVLPAMLRRFYNSHPCVTVDVLVDGSTGLRAQLAAGLLDLALIPCVASGDAADGAEILVTERLVWAARRGGLAPSQTPLPLSLWQEGCVRRDLALKALTRQGRDWRIAFQSAQFGGQRAAILADLAVAPVPASCLGGDIVEVPKTCGLPDLGQYGLGLLIGPQPEAAVTAAAEHLRQCFAAPGALQDAPASTASSASA